jgi:hypothetical protein
MSKNLADLSEKIRKIAASDVEKDLQLNKVIEVNDETRENNALDAVVRTLPSCEELGEEGEKCSATRNELGNKLINEYVEEYNGKLQEFDDE